MRPTATDRGNGRFEKGAVESDRGWGRADVGRASAGFQPGEMRKNYAVVEADVRVCRREAGIYGA